MPIAANCHGLTSAKIPWLAADAARTPSKKAPLTLTTTVPHGNVSPTRRATKPDNQNLALPPSPLPRATHMAPLIVSTACLVLFSARDICLTAPLALDARSSECCQESSPRTNDLRDGAHHSWLARHRYFALR